MSSHPFATLPPTPAVHFKLYFYAAVLRLIEHVTQALGSFAATFEQFPFLTGYRDELAAHGLNGLTLDGASQLVARRVIRLGSNGPRAFTPARFT